MSPFYWTALPQAHLNTSDKRTLPFAKTCWSSYTRDINEFLKSSIFFNLKIQIVPENFTDICASANVWTSENILPF